tara:strand:+ start:232 stop:1086 length:855 start_codon:yes stop_codon:yes gene_type:complete
VSNSNNYIKDYPTVESSFENVLQLLAGLPPQERLKQLISEGKWTQEDVDKLLKDFEPQEEKLRGYQKLAGNPYIKILPEDTPGYSHLNRAWYKEVGKKYLGRPGEYSKDLPDTAYVFEHLLKEDLLAELPHGIQYEYARKQNRKDSPGFLEGLYEKFRKKYFPTAHDEINDVLKEFQSSRTVKELHAQTSKERSKFGEDVYGYGKDSTGEGMFPFIFDNTKKEGEMRLRVKTEGVSSLEDLRRVRGIWEIPASGEGIFQPSPPFEWIAHSLLEEILKKDLENTK